MADYVKTAREGHDSTTRRGRWRWSSFVVISALGAICTLVPRHADACTAVTVPPPTVLANGVWEIAYTINQCGAVYTPQTRFRVQLQVRYTPQNTVAPIMIANPTVTGEIGTVIGTGERVVHWDSAADQVPPGSRIEPILTIRAPHNYVRGGAFSVANYLVDDNVPQISIGPSASFGRFLTNYLAVEAEVGVGAMDSEVSSLRYSASLKQDIIMGNVRVRAWTWKRLSIDGVGGIGGTNQFEESELGGPRRAWELSFSGGADVNIAITTRVTLSGGARGFWVDRDQTTLPLSAAAIHVPVWIQYRF